METWKPMLSNGMPSRTAGSVSEAAMDPEQYALEYLNVNDQILISWLDKNMRSGRIVVCTHCYFAGLADEDCRVCAGLPEKARAVFAEHEANDLFGPYLRGTEDINRELVKLRTERIETLYNLSEGAYEAVVALSIQAALGGLSEFWRVAEQRRERTPFRLTVAPEAAEPQRGDFAVLQKLADMPAVAGIPAE